MIHKIIKKVLEERSLLRDGDIETNPGPATWKQEADGWYISSMILMAGLIISIIINVYMIDKLAKRNKKQLKLCGDVESNPGPQSKPKRTYRKKKSQETTEQEKPMFQRERVDMLTASSSWGIEEQEAYQAYLQMKRDKQKKYSSDPIWRAEKNKKEKERGNVIKEGLNTLREIVPIPKNSYRKPSNVQVLQASINFIQCKQELLLAKKEGLMGDNELQQQMLKEKILKLKDTPITPYGSYEYREVFQQQFIDDIKRRHMDKSNMEEFQKEFIQNQEDQWIRPLNMDGDIESNPGPKHNQKLDKTMAEEAILERANITDQEKKLVLKEYFREINNKRKRIRIEKEQSTLKTQKYQNDRHRLISQSIQELKTIIPSMVPPGTTTMVSTVKSAINHIKYLQAKMGIEIKDGEELVKEHLRKDPNNLTDMITKNPRPNKKIIGKDITKDPHWDGTFTSDMVERKETK